MRSLHLGLEDRLDAKMGTLSGGERQALTLLMATLVKPSLLLLDEHTAALDPRSVEQVVKLTERVVSSQRLTTLMVTHSMHQAVRLGDRVLMMHRGPDRAGDPRKGEAAAEGGEPAGDVRPARGAWSSLTSRRRTCCAACTSSGAARRRGNMQRRGTAAAHLDGGREQRA